MGAQEILYILIIMHMICILWRLPMILYMLFQRFFIGTGTSIRWIQFQSYNFFDTVNALQWPHNGTMASQITRLILVYTTVIQA